MERDQLGKNLREFFLPDSLPCFLDHFSLCETFVVQDLKAEVWTRGYKAWVTPPSPASVPLSRCFRAGGRPPHLEGILTLHLTGLQAGTPHNKDDGT
ncbi:hypothetical protein MC885_004139, partial [Smutsia gigantea]